MHVNTATEMRVVVLVMYICNNEMTSVLIVMQDDKVDSQDHLSVSPLFLVILIYSAKFVTLI